jgi:hypothetical protein
VAWITQIKNLLAMFFYLLAILAYLEFEYGEVKAWYFCSVIAFLVALLSKTSVVTLPFVLLGCVCWHRGSIRRKDLVRILPFLALGGILGLNEIWFQYDAIGEDTVRTDSFFSRSAGAGWAVWFYPYRAIIPYKLSFVYQRWDIHVSSIVSYLPGMLLLGGFVVFWRYRRGWGRSLLFGLGYYVVTLPRVLGFFDVNFMRFSLVTDHWQYASIIGIITLMVGVGVWIWDRWRSQLHHLATFAAAAMVGLLCVLTWSRCQVFQDLESLRNSTKWKSMRFFQRERSNERSRPRVFFAFGPAERRVCRLES